MLSHLQNVSEQLSYSEKMPLLFMGHGSPMNAIEDNQFTRGFHEISKTIPKPHAILCISAHWFTEGSFVTSNIKQRTIHDFYGFPKELYQIEYTAKGEPKLAQETTELLLPNPVIETDNWGLDHGTWSVLTHLYPEANIPVIQLSIDYTKPASYHYQLAQQLQILRRKGVLIIGSGNIIHNLRLVDFKNINTIGFGYDWAIEAREKTNDWILDGNFQNLIDYQKQGLFLQYAIPTPDHFLPLIYTLGLKDPQDEIQLFNDELIAGSLSMTSVRIG